MKKILLIALIATNLFGYIYPLNYIISDIFRNRKNTSFQLWQFKHHVKMGSETFDIEEQLLKEGNQIFCFWKIPAHNTLIGASYSQGGYQFPKEKWYSKSAIPLKNFTATSIDEMKEALLNERFIRRDQMLQYVAGFSPEGDPQTWNIKQNYMPHPDISLSHFDDMVGVAVTGLKEGNTKKTVVFDRNLRGLLKLEWKEEAAPKNVQWLYSNFARLSQGKGSYTTSYFPRKSVLSFDNSEIATSELISLNTQDTTSVKEFKTQYAAAIKNSFPSSNVQLALKYLLSYR
jgi:hypothetical protein